MIFTSNYKICVGTHSSKELQLEYVKVEQTEPPSEEYIVEV